MSPGRGGRTVKEENLIKGDLTKIKYMKKDMERVKSEKQHTQDRLDALQKEFEANKKHQQHRIDELMKKLNKARNKADKASMMAAADEV